MIKAKELIRDIKDFPKTGIVFKDITPVLQNGEAFREVISTLAEKFKKERVEKVAAIEARGFIIGGALANALRCGFVPIRKSGKLPYKTVACEYSLEYGTDKVEMHEDAIAKGERILLVDDLLATGGTMGAAAKLVESLGGKIVGIAFFIELKFLKGRERLKKYNVVSLVEY